MVITDRLVFVHLPKTGGTFVTAMLAQVHLRRLGPLGRRAAVQRLAGRLGLGFRELNKHGGCAEIPARHRDKPILGCIRNPYERYVSRYDFGFWREHPRPWWDWRSIRGRYPHFPDVSFAEFVDVCSSMFHKLPVDGPPEQRLGSYTEELVRLYFREPERVVGLIDDAYIAARAWERDMLGVRFLRTENLNRELHDALVELGYPPNRVAFILDAERVRPPRSSRAERPAWERYYTPELKAMVRERERLLFALFPEYEW